MIENIERQELLTFQNQLSKCVNAKHTTFSNKDLIISNSPTKKRIGFIIYGKASIIKTDINGNTTIMRELKQNDIFSNLFFWDSEDDIYIISNRDRVEIHGPFILQRICYFLPIHKPTDGGFQELRLQACQ